MAIFCETTGKGDNIVILHGWGGATHTWMQPIVEQLSNDYCVMNFDLPGCGQNLWQPGTETIEEMANQLLPHLPPQATYIAWSISGLLTLSIAARYPEKVKQIVGIGTSPKFIESENWEGFPQPGYTAGFKIAIQESGIDNIRKGFFDAEFEGFNPKPASYHRIINIIDNDPTSDLEALFKGIEICDKTDLRQLLKTITCPIDMIFGSEDANVPIAAHEKIKALAPHMRTHLINGAHHAPFWTHPEQFNTILSSIMGEK